MKRDVNKPRRDEGVALLLALLFIVLMTVLIVEYSYETEVDASIVTANISDFESLVAAKSGVAAGMSLLVTDILTPPGTQPGTGGTPQAGRTSSAGSSTRGAVSGGAAYDSLDEPWAYGVPFQEFNGAIMQCTIADEFGKLNINALLDRRGEPNATLEEALRFLFNARGAVEDPVDAILDWIDPDDDPRPLGAEYDYYQSLGTPYPCKNGPMASIQELLLVRGVTPEVFFGDPQLQQVPLTELLTVYGHRNGRVNVNTAQPELLVALGESLGMQGLAELVVQERELGPFVSNQDLVTRGVLPPQDDSGAGTRRARPFTVNSMAFRLQGNGISAGTRVRIEAYVWRDARSGSDGFRVLDWREVR